MITPLTQAAIAILGDIIYRNDTEKCSPDSMLTDATRTELLGKLASSGLIKLIDADHPQQPASYVPLKTPNEISLLDILEATGEHLNCNHPTTETFYARYGRVAHKLGVVNQMTRLYLQDIKLFDL